MSKKNKEIIIPSFSIVVWYLNKSFFLTYNISIVFVKSKFLCPPLFKKLIMVIPIFTLLIFLLHVRYLSNCKKALKTVKIIWLVSILSINSIFNIRNLIPLLNNYWTISKTTRVLLANRSTFDKIKPSLFLTFWVLN